MIETVTVHRAREDGTDRYGNTILDWDGATDTEVPAAIAPEGPVEARGEGRAAAVSTPVVYLPPGTDIAATDRITVRGDVYEVDDEPSVWRNPYSGRQVGIRVGLRKVTG